MKSSLITFIIGMVLVVFGSIMTAFEVMDYTIIDVNASDNSLIEKKTEIVDISPYSYCIDLDVRDDKDLDVSYSIIYDDTLGDEIVLEYSYIKNVYNIHAYKEFYDGCTEIDVEYNINIWKSFAKSFIQDFYNNLKEKKIYNYTEFNNIKVDIKVNPKYRNNIRVH